MKDTEKRTELKDFYGKKVIVQGRISKFGYRNGDLIVPHICISDAYIVLADDISQNVKVDHFWIKYTNRIKKVDPKQNDFVMFTAIVDKYISVEGWKYAPNKNIRNFKIIEEVKYRPNINKKMKSKKRRKK